MQYQTIDGMNSPDKAVKRLINENAINLASCYARLKIVSNDFTKQASDYAGPIRDLVVSVIYAAHDNILVLGQLGARDVLDAVRFNSMDAADYHKQLLTQIGEAIEADDNVQAMHTTYAALVERVRPSQKDAVAEGDELDAADLAAAANDAAPQAEAPQVEAEVFPAAGVAGDDTTALADNGVS